MFAGSVRHALTLGVYSKVELVVRGGGTQRPACTDVLWNQANMKGVAPAPVSKIDFYTDKAKEKIRNSSSRQRRSAPQPL